MFKVLGVLFVGYLLLGVMVWLENIVGVFLFIAAYIFLIRHFSTSIYGAFDKTPLEIQNAIEKRNNPAAYMSKLPQEERSALRTEYRRKGTEYIGKGRVRHQRRTHGNQAGSSVIASVGVLSSCSVEETTTPPIIDTTITSDDTSSSLEVIPSYIDEMIVNPTTGLPMIGGVGGIDVSGHLYGEPDTSLDDSFSSFDNSSTSFCDSNDSFGCDMGDW